MGSAISSVDKGENAKKLALGPDPNMMEKLAKFNRKSKSGVGVHVFCFTKPGAGPGGSDSIIFVGSEVTDENGILDVKFTEWKREYAAMATNEIKGGSSYFAPKTSKLKEVWSPVYTFHSGRLAIIAVAHLLDDGYQMSRCKPENGFWQ